MGVLMGDLDAPHSLVACNLNVKRLLKTYLANGCTEFVAIQELIVPQTAILGGTRPYGALVQAFTFRCVGLLALFSGGLHHEVAWRRAWSA